jgi:hypothetical protein
VAQTGHDPVTESFADQVDAAVSAEGERQRLAAALALLPAAHRDTLLSAIKQGYVAAPGWPGN